jgi:hypothetical protein
MSLFRRSGRMKGINLKYPTITSSFSLHLHLIILLSITLVAAKESSKNKIKNYGHHWGCSKFFFSYPVFEVDCNDNNLVAYESQKYSNSCNVAGAKTTARTSEDSPSITQESTPLLLP